MLRYLAVVALLVAIASSARLARGDSPSTPPFAPGLTAQCQDGTLDFNPPSSQTYVPPSYIYSPVQAASAVITPVASAASALAPTSPAVTAAPSAPITMPAPIDVQAAVLAVSRPLTIGRPLRVDATVDGTSIVPLTVETYLDQTSTSPWLALGRDAQLAYLQRVISVLHTTYPSVAPIYLSIDVWWRGSDSPSPIPLEWWDACTDSTYAWCFWYPDLTARWDGAAFSYTTVYVRDSDTWLPFPCEEYPPCSGALPSLSSPS